MESQDGAWLGAIYVKCEGGHEVILRSLDHYERRLKSIGKSPELGGAAAMFASVLYQQARKTIPEIAAVRGRIIDGLAGTSEKCGIASIVDDIKFIEKALLCHKSDILKACETDHEYFQNLIGDTESAKNHIGEIETACERIKEFE